VNDPKDRETILYAFAVEPSRDQNTLDRYLAQYPELTEELIDLAFELRFAEAQTPMLTDPATDSGLQSAWQEFIECTPATAKPAKTASFLSKFRGQAFADLATRLSVPRSILTAFRDRLVEPLSVPEQFLRRFADAAESSLQEVRDYLSSPPLIIGTAQFKADKKPSHQGRVTFRHLVESTEMTDEEREVLLKDCHADGLERS
jgi:hypothetical protein